MQQQNQVITGKFLGAKATQFVGQNNFAIRSFYIDITDNPEYPNTPEFQLKGDKVNLVDNLQKGQTVQIKFNIDGRKYTNREGKAGVITNLNVWKIDVVQTQSAAVVNRPPAGLPAAPAAPVPAAGVPAGASMGGPGQYAKQQALGEFATQGAEPDLPF